MINGRPKLLLNDPSYRLIPKGPIGLDLSSVPEWIKLSMLNLGGVQPITKAMLEAADYEVSEYPTVGELELYRNEGTRFQIVLVVVSIAAFHSVGSRLEGVPYMISVIPANRRGTELSVVDADYIQRVDLSAAIVQQSPLFWNLDPFSGDWESWASSDLIIGQKPREGFVDGLGFVTDAYYLQLGFNPSTVCDFNYGMGEGKPFTKYMKRRQRLMFTQFNRMETRRIWGTESPIELFLYQGLLREGLRPILQMLLFDDGSTYPSIDHLWAEGLADIPSLITEADMYFPAQRVAVFCDSTKHHRGQKAAEKDSAITLRLSQIGVRSVRVPGSLIVHDLKSAVELVACVVN